MHRRRLSHGAITATALTLLFGILPSQAFAQDEMEAETRVITMTTFHVPTNEMSDFNELIENFIMPQTLADPHVLSFRYATHAWGNSKMNAWMITEYADMAAIQASAEWGNEWVDENYPEGTPEREEWDAATEAFLEHFDGHQDNILGVNMDRAK